LFVAHSNYLHNAGQKGVL